MLLQAGHASAGLLVAGTAKSNALLFYLSESIDASFWCNSKALAMWEQPPSVVGGARDSERGDLVGNERPPHKVGAEWQISSVVLSN